MIETPNARFIRWFEGLQAIAQNGLTYSENPFDIERFKQIREIAAEMAADVSDITQEKITALFNDNTHYATPKLDVRGIIFDEQKRILLVQERVDQCWTPPGGWIDVNESPAESVTREIREESGFESKVVKLLAVYDKHKHTHPDAWPHTYKLFFLCELIGGSATPGIETNIETLDAQFFAKDELPPLSTPRITQEQILRCYEHLEHPEWFADFD